MAARSRYDRREIHRRLGHYFQRAIADQSQVSRRSASETTYQQHQAEEYHQLADTLSAIPVAIALSQDQTRYELLQYWAELRSSDHDPAVCYGQSVEAYATCTSEPSEFGRALNTVAGLLWELGCWDGAGRIWQQQQQLARRHSLSQLEAQAEAGRGVLCQMRGSFAEALGHLRSAEALHNQLDDRLDAARVVGHMGITHASLADYDRAFECFHKQLATFREFNNRRGEARTIGNIGLAHWHLGRYDAALECYEQYLAMCRELGDRSGTAAAIGNMGLVYSHRHEYDRALECYSKQLEIRLEIGDRHGAALAVGNMAHVYEARGEYHKALESYFHALAEHREIGDRYGVTHWLKGRGGVLLNIARGTGHAPGYLQEFIPEATGSQWRQVLVEHAREDATTCIEIAREISSPDTLFPAYMLLAEIEVFERRYADAEGYVDIILAESTDDAEHAELHYQMWNAYRANADDPGAQAGRLKHQQAALQLYCSLAGTETGRQYQRIIDQLEEQPPQA